MTAGYHKHTFSGPRPWETIEAVPYREVAGCSRGEIRLGAEVALAELCAVLVPTFVHERAMGILKVLAA